MTFKTFLKTSLVAAALGFTLGAPVALADDDVYSPFSVSAETSSVSVNYRPIKDLSGALGAEQDARFKMAFDRFDGRIERFMDQYISYLSGVQVQSLGRDDQLAYWLNTRNFLVTQAISELPSLRRFEDARGTPDAPGEAWTKKRITVAGVELSIDDIEQRIILANFADDPNVIYGLYQGSESGPAYARNGFTGAGVRGELAAIGRDFVNSRDGVHARRSKATVAQIYDWYGTAVFNDSDDELKTHLTSLAEGRNASRLAAVDTFEAKKFSFRVEQFKVPVQRPAAGGGGGGGFGGGVGGGGGGGGGS